MNHDNELHRMSDFVPVCKTGDILDPGKASYEVDDRFVVVIHAGGTFYCLDDVCTHDGGPLGDGELCGFSIACPRHGAEFDIRTGEALTMPATEPTLVHDVRVEGDQVFVRLTGE